MRATPRIHDESGLFGFSIIRWILVIILFGLVAVEGGSIIFTTIGLQNAADAAAVEAAEVWGKSQNFPLTQTTAIQALEDREQDRARITEFEADRFEPFEVRFTVRKQASTLIVHRIGFLEDLAQVEVEAKARPVEAGV